MQPEVNKRAKATKDADHLFHLTHRLHMIDREMKDMEEQEGKTGTREDPKLQEARRAQTPLRSLTREVGLFRSMQWDSERDEEFGTA